MKLNIIAAVTAVFFSMTGYAASNPEIVPINFNKIYVPDGFDDNDNVEIVGEGMMPNSCYRYADTAVEVDQENKKILLRSTAYKYRGMCLMLVIPYDHVVKVGILKAGDYSIVQADNGKEIGRISVRKATSDGADDHLYAPISQAYFKSGCITDHVFIRGQLPSSCMRLKEVKLTVQTDVVVLQPIVEIDPQVPCEDGSFPFERGVNVGFLPKGRYLGHIRSLNGKSVNEIFETTN